MDWRVAIEPLLDVFREDEERWTIQLVDSTAVLQQAGRPEYELLAIAVDGRVIGHLWFGSRLPGVTASQLALQAFSDIQDMVAEDDSFWGQARPPCHSGHRHALIARETAEGLALMCPDGNESATVINVPVGI